MLDNGFPVSVFLSNRFLFATFRSIGVRLASGGWGNQSAKYQVVTDYGLNELHYTPMMIAGSSTVSKILKVKWVVRSPPRPFTIFHA